MSGAKPPPLLLRRSSRLFLLFVLLDEGGNLVHQLRQHSQGTADGVGVVRQLDGAEETVNYRTLVNDSLENSEEDVRDEHFLYLYVLLMRLAATGVLFYMIVRWLI